MSYRPGNTETGGRGEDRYGAANLGVAAYSADRAPGGRVSDESLAC